MSSEAFKRYLKKKIAINIDEYRKGRWVSPQQAIAVSYSQARKKFNLSPRRKKSARRAMRKKY
jgi:predicted transcriptional regulator